MYVSNAQGLHSHTIVSSGSGPNYVQSDVPTSPVWLPGTDEDQMLRVVFVELYR